MRALCYDDISVNYYKIICGQWVKVPFDNKANYVELYNIIEGVMTFIGFGMY